MMDIKINDNYRVTADSKQYVLQEIKVAKEGKNAGEEVATSIGFYGKIEHVLQSFKEHKIRTSNIKNFNELLEEIKSIDKTIKDILGGN